MNADNITRADTIIDEVLARDEFNGGSDRVGVNWLVEIIKKIYKFLEDLFKKFWEWLSKLLENCISISAARAKAPKRSK